MIFLVAFHRPTQLRQTFRQFADHQREEASAARLQLELSVAPRAMEFEVVLLDAPSETALRRTHSRYFPDQNAAEELDAAIRSAS